MKELVEYLAKNLVDKPESVQVVEREEPNAFVIEVTVAPEDMGKVIGKQGRIAKAIRMIVKAASSKSPKKYIVEIL